MLSHLHMMEFHRILGSRTKLGRVRRLSVESEVGSIRCTWGLRIRKRKTAVWERCVFHMTFWKMMPKWFSPRYSSDSPWPWWIEQVKWILVHGKTYSLVWYRHAHLDRLVERYNNCNTGGITGGPITKIRSVNYMPLICMNFISMILTRLHPA